MRKLVSMSALAALASLALVACGGGDDETTTTNTGAGGGGATTTTSGGGGGGGAESTLAVEADKTQLAYKQDSLTTKAGSVTIDFKNPAQIPHNVTIEASGEEEIGATDTITNGSTSTTVDLKPGTYMFFCSVDGHEAAGMEGTLKVQ